MPEEDLQVDHSTVCISFICCQCAVSHLLFCSKAMRRKCDICMDLTSWSTQNIRLLCPVCRTQAFRPAEMIQSFILIAWRGCFLRCRLSRLRYGAEACPEQSVHCLSLCHSSTTSAAKALRWAAFCAVRTDSAHRCVSLFTNCASAPCASISKVRYAALPNAGQDATCCSSRGNRGCCKVSNLYFSV